MDEKELEEQIKRMPQLTMRELEKRFSFHPANTKKKQDDHETIRRQCLDLAEFLNHLLPDSDEKEIAVKKLEEVMFWANAGIARRS